MIKIVQRLPWVIADSRLWPVNGAFHQYRAQSRRVSSHLPLTLLIIPAIREL
jgi:hypothetical protein